MLVDTHCHLDFTSFHDDLVDVIKRALDAGVERMVIPAIDIESAHVALDLSSKHPELFCAVGVHPTSLPSPPRDNAVLNELSLLAAELKVCAIGEIGLDYHWMKTSIDHQRGWFMAQIALADQYGLPIIIHNRDASNDILSCLKEASLKSTRTERLASAGVLHSFSGDVALAHEAISMGYKIGLSGVITYKKSEEIQSIISLIPPDAFVLETDAPFLAPVPHRGKRNEPAFIIHVASQVGTLRGMTTEEVSRLTSRNALSLFPRMSDY